MRTKEKLQSPIFSYMKLFIDTSDRDKITIGLDGKKFETEARKEASQKLLPFIIDTMEKEGKVLKDIAEIEVALGPGSFTGLRVGVSVAQTLGWVLEIPVNGKNLSQGEVLEIKYE